MRCMRSYYNNNIIDFKDEVNKKKKKDKLKNYMENKESKDDKVKRGSKKNKNQNDKRKKYKKNIPLVNLIFVLIGFTLTIYIVSSLVQQEKKINQIKENKAKVEKEIQREKIINQNLKKQIENVDTNKFIERSAREKLKMIYDGEIMYIDTAKME